jgi:hypothetical protein
MSAIFVHTSYGKIFRHGITQRRQGTKAQRIFF